ncbi:MAG: OmpA family protein [Granulosicoccus sp.]
MAAHTLQIDLPDSERPSIWPWLIALLAAACLMVVLAQKLKSIPLSLELQAQSLVQAENLQGVDVLVDGRDLTLRGTVPINRSVAQLFEKISAIVGVRQVTDALTVIDPVQIANQKKSDFQQALANIDISTVAFQPGNISFASGSETALQQLLEILLSNQDFRIRIEGHTDDTGPAAVNLRLSRERAAAVSNYLQSRGVLSNQLIAKGYGSTQPIADNSTDAGRARNRRIEISYVD